MSKKIELKVKTRSDQEENTGLLRNDGFVPAVVYGSGSKNISLKAAQNDIEKVYKMAGESNLVDLAIDNDEAFKVIIKEAQKEPMRGAITHVDFYKVDMNKPIEIEIPLSFIGEANAVKELGGTLVTSLNTVHAKCLPGDLIDSLEVDLSAIEDFNASIKVGDLNIPDNIELIGSVDDIIASAVEQQVEVEPEKVEDEGAAAEGDEAAKGEEGKKEGGKDAKVDDKKDGGKKEGDKKGVGKKEEKK